MAIGGGIALGVLSTASTQQRQKKIRKQQRKLQRVREKRERNRLFAEQQRALAESQVQLGVRGATESSAGANVPGAIQTQFATEQGFLNQVGQITGNINAYQSQISNIQAATQLVSTGINFYQQGKSEGLFNKGKV